MKSLFFEDPFWLYALLLMAEGVLVTLWRRRGDRKSALRLLIPPAMAALIFALATLVVTDRERIKEATQKLVAGLNAGRTTELASRLASDFRGTFRGMKPLKRGETLERVQKALRQHGVAKITIKSLKVKVRGDQATVHLVTMIELRGKMFRGKIPARWTLQWVKQGKRWLIRDARGP